MLVLLFDIFHFFFKHFQLITDIYFKISPAWTQSGELQTSVKKKEIMLIKGSGSYNCKKCNLAEFKLPHTSCGRNDIGFGCCSG